MKISKKSAFSNLVSLDKNNPRLLNRVLEEFQDMASGGKGGPFQVSYRWSTVRDHYYPGWEDHDFYAVLNDFKNYKKKF